MEYCCDRPDSVVLGRIAEGLWDSGLERALGVESPVGLLCRRLGDENPESNAGSGGLACDVQRDTETLPGHLCAEPVGAWSSAAEEYTVID